MLNAGSLEQVVNVQFERAWTFARKCRQFRKESEQHMLRGIACEAQSTERTAWLLQAVQLES